jgi:hypothetical protein
VDLADRYCWGVAEPDDISQVFKPKRGKGMKELLDHLDKIVLAATAFGTFIVFALGLYKYWRAESWKRTEFVARLYKEFSDDPDCEVALYLLGGDRRIIFYKQGDEWKSYEYDYGVLCEALDVSNANRVLDAKHLHIRDSLDQFFVYIEQFDRAIECKLVSQADVYPYFGYWIGLLHGDPEIKPLMDDDARKKTLKYMIDAGFDDAENFFLKRKWDV